MTQNDSQFSFRMVNRMAHISSKAWDELAGPLTTPLLEWQWLYHLESSGSICAETGWHPCHLTVWSGKRMVGAAPLYIKTHSLGEFVFDQAWSRVATELGIRYYPKLVGMSPLTPSAGYRFLIAPDQDQTRLTELMLTEIDQFCLNNGLSGVNFLFVDPAWGSELPAHGFAAWRHQGFIWHNDNYRDFDDFLREFKANQRRNIKRERQQMEQQGIELKIFAGDQIPVNLIAPMYRFYSRTNAQFGPYGCHFLTSDFFQGIYADLRKRLMFVAAYGRESRDTPIALAMLLHKAQRIIGRYWGAANPIKDLHFNTCYYAPMEWAIQHHIKQFDPGAGSYHKIRRGFKAIANHSYHRFYDPRMARLLRTHIDAINRGAQAQIDELNVLRPMKMPQGSAHFLG